jgi:two-component system, sensor histidine kinase and response regulator
MNAASARLVLVADDEDPMREILTTIVEDLGHQVLGARDGDEALRLATHHRPDLIITDFMMPGRTGIELIRAVRANASLAAVPIILISAASPEAANEATRFLAKPLQLRDLEAEVERLLAHRPAAARERDTPLLGPLGGVVLPEALNWLAHELRTPIAAVRMKAELLSRRLDVIGNDQDRARVRAILRGLDLVTKLMGSMLDAAALGEGKLALRLAPIDLMQFVERIVASWRDLYPEFDVTLTRPADALSMRLDETRIREVLDNLLSNAVKYGAARKRIEVTVTTRGGQVVISVRDYGPGIPAAELPHLFERFHRNPDATAPGHGLGLFIAAALTRLHGGSLGVTSTLGEGSTFSLSLPVAGA